MSTANDKVSIIIVTHNSSETIGDCLESLSLASAKLSGELIVVDNNSHDNSPSLVRRLRPDAQVIVNRKNIGFAAACNTAVRQARGDYLLFVNPDVQVDLDAPEQLLHSLSALPAAGAATGRIRFPDGQFQPTCRQFPTWANIWSSRGSLLTRLFGGGSGYTLGDPATGGNSAPVAVPAVAATLLMIRRKLFNMVGGFDERFFVFLEDTDLCYRLNGLSCINYSIPTAGASHNWGKGSASGRWRRSWYHHRSIWLYFRKHLPSPATWLLLPGLLIGNLVATILLPQSAQGKPLRQ